MCYAFEYFRRGKMLAGASITFAEIWNFIVKNILWFVIPIDIIILTLLVVIIVKHQKSKKKGRKKRNERKR